MNVDQTVYVYAWMKVVPVDAGAPKQMLAECNNQVMHHRIDTKDLEGKSLECCMSGGIVAVTESARFSDDKRAFSMCLRGMEVGETFEQASAWISTQEGQAWTRDAVAWVLVYSHSNFRSN